MFELEKNVEKFIENNFEEFLDLVAENNYIEVLKHLESYFGKEVFRLYGYLGRYNDILFGRGEVIDHECCATIVNILIKKLVLPRITVSAPERPEPDFVDISTELSDADEATVRHACSKIISGSPISRLQLKNSELSVAIDVSLTRAWRYEANELLEKWHPRLYEAELRADIRDIALHSPAVTAVGWKTVKIEKTIGATNLIDETTMYKIAKLGYIVWGDGFAVKSETPMMQATINRYYPRPEAIYYGYQELVKYYKEGIVKLFL